MELHCGPLVVSRALQNAIYTQLVLGFTQIKSQLNHAFITGTTASGSDHVLFFDRPDA